MTKHVELVVLHAGCTEDEALTAVDQAQLHFPMLAKPFWTDGRQGCHGLALLQGLEGLKRLVKGTGPPGVELPVMLQPFIEHGGCLFKASLTVTLWHCCLAPATDRYHETSCLFKTNLPLIH